ncbi:MAG: T9SS type A sorting domain-containing protein [Saprospiraceae bacterium]
MRKLLFILIITALSQVAFGQIESVQGTVRSEPGYIIAVYSKPSITVTASNPSNGVTIDIAVSINKGAFNAPPVPVVTSQIAGLNPIAVAGSPTLENGRYVYTYILSAGLSPFSWTAGAEFPVMKLDFPNSPNFTGNFPRLQNDPNGGQTLLSYFYYEVNSTDYTNYTNMFYGGTLGILGSYNYVEAVTPLPVTLVSFKAEKFQDRSVHLTWATASEINSSHFLVQSSTDKKSWTNLGSVKAAGNSQLIENYEFFDYNVYNGRDSRLTVYYRLQMVDLDGQVKTSPAESVIFGNGIAPGRDFVVYPNPASDGIQIEWDANLIDQPTSLEFYDVQGKLVYTQKVSDNTNQEYIDFGHSTIIPGLYLLRILNGQEPLDFKQIVVGQR